MFFFVVELTVCCFEYRKKAGSDRRKSGSMSSAEQKRHMYRTRNEFVREFVRVRNECIAKKYPVHPDFSGRSEYVESDQTSIHNPCRSESGNGAVNFYNYALTLCTPTDNDVSPSFFRLKKKTDGLVPGNIIIDQCKCLIREATFSSVAEAFYDTHTSTGLIKKFEELARRAPQPDPLPPDPLEPLLLKYAAMLK